MRVGQYGTPIAHMYHLVPGAYYVFSIFQFFDFDCRTTAVGVQQQEDQKGMWRLSSFFEHVLLRLLWSTISSYCTVLVPFSPAPKGSGTK